MKKIKVKCCSNCDKGMHDFIVSKWQITASYQKANEITCTKCLLNLDLNELASARLMHESEK